MTHKGPRRPMPRSISSELKKKDSIKDITQEPNVRIQTNGSSDQGKTKTANIAAVVSLPPPTTFLVLSDTIGKSGFPKCYSVIPNKIDVVLHCGDLSLSGKLSEYHDTIDLIASLPAPLKLVIAGDRDVSLDRDFWMEHALPSERELYAEARKLWTGAKARKAGITFLDTGIYEFNLENGSKLKVYANAATPKDLDAGLWAFGTSTDDDIYNPEGTGPSYGNFVGTATSQIPDDVDIDVFLTHGGARYHFDTKYNDEDVNGCSYLFRALRRIKPKLHAYGHKHEHYKSQGVYWWPEEDEVMPPDDDMADDGIMSCGPLASEDVKVQLVKKLNDKLLCAEMRMAKRVLMPGPPSEAESKLTVVLGAALTGDYRIFEHLPWLVTLQLGPSLAGAHVAKGCANPAVEALTTRFPDLNSNSPGEKTSGKCPRAGRLSPRFNSSLLPGESSSNTVPLPPAKNAPPSALASFIFSPHRDSVAEQLDSSSPSGGTSSDVPRAGSSSQGDIATPFPEGPSSRIVPIFDAENLNQAPRSPSYSLLSNQEVEDSNSAPGSPSYSPPPPQEAEDSKSAPEESDSSPPPDSEEESSNQTPGGSGANPPPDSEEEGSGEDSKSENSNPDSNSDSEVDNDTEIQEAVREALYPNPAGSEEVNAHNSDPVERAESVSRISSVEGDVDRDVIAQAENSSMVAETGSVDLPLSPSHPYSHLEQQRREGSGHSSSIQEIGRLDAGLALAQHPAQYQDAVLDRFLAQYLAEAPPQTHYPGAGLDQLLAQYLVQAPSQIVGQHRAHFPDQAPSYHRIHVLNPAQHPTQHGAHFPGQAPSHHRPHAIYQAQAQSQQRAQYGAQYAPQYTVQSSPHFPAQHPPQYQSQDVGSHQRLEALNPALARIRAQTEGDYAAVSRRAREEDKENEKDEEERRKRTRFG